MIFVDTSALFALVDPSDPHHARAAEAARSLVSRGVPLLSHNYVVIEATRLAHRRLGREPAATVEAVAANFEIEWIDALRHREAFGRWRQRHGKVSFVDEVSFLVMRERGIDTAFAFDAHFRREGFKTL